jgi:hypothetical protein
MATEQIVKSIFGPTPLEIEQANRQRVQGLYSSFGQMGGEAGLGGVLGVGLGQLAKTVFDIKDPELTKAKDMSMILTEIRQTMTEEDMMNPNVYFPRVIKKLDEKGYGVAASQIREVGADEIAKWNKQKLEAEKARNTLTSQGLTEIEKLKRAVNMTKLALKSNPDDPMLLQDLADYEAAIAKKLESTPSLTEQIAQDYVTISNPNASKTEKQNAQNRINMYHSKSQLGKEGTYIAEDGSIQTIKGGKQWNEAIADLDKKLNNYVRTNHSLEVAEREIKTAIPLVNEKSAGFVAGGGLGVPGLATVSGTEAFNLNQKLDSIKAIIGFNRLQEMRELSKTGGALGQVAVRELEFLQAVEGSLKIGQTPEQLKKSLQYVLEQYQQLQKDLERITNDARNKLAEEYGVQRPNPITYSTQATTDSSLPNSTSEVDINAPQELEEVQLLLDSIFAPKDTTP